MSDATFLNCSGLLACLLACLLEKSFSGHMFVIARFTCGGGNLYPASTRLITLEKIMKSFHL